MATPLIDYRLRVYVRLWDLILASETNRKKFLPLNRVRFDTALGSMKLVEDKDLTADFPKLGIYYGNGDDGGWPPRYDGGYDAGTIIAVSQNYTVKLTFETPEIVFASPLIAEVRASILRGGPRLGGAAAGFGYVRRSGAATAQNFVGPNDETDATNRLVTTFDVNVTMNLTIGQLVGV